MFAKGPRMSIAPFSTPGRFWRGNLHTHSTLSDGARAPEQVIEAYKRAGYDFVQLSEHFMARFGWPIADTRRWRSNSFTTLIGAELHAPATKIGELWHILAAGLPLDFAAPAPGETGPQIAARASAQGAFIAIAHPAWSQLTIEDGRALAHADAVEIYNHGGAVENDRGDGCYLMDQLLSEGRRLTGVATDDAHFADGDYDAFGGFVEVKAESLEPEALLAALKAGDFYSSQGPRFHDISFSGREASIECSPVQAITLVTGTSRTFTRIGRQITAATFDLTAIVQNNRAANAPARWVRATIIDAAGRRAWSNPIWLDDFA
jgi:histidinol phosphatase-like PHP family hydrolase